MNRVGFVDGTRMSDRKSSCKERDISKSSKHARWRSCARPYLHGIVTYLAKRCLLYPRAVSLSELGKDVHVDHAVG